MAHYPFTQLYGLNPQIILRLSFINSLIENSLHKNLNLYNIIKNKIESFIKNPIPM